MDTVTRHVDDPKAWAEGVEVCRDGGTKESNPYVHDTDQYIEWINGFDCMTAANSLDKEMRS